MRKALLVINTTTYFTGLVEIGRLLLKRSDFVPIFYFTQPYSQYQDHLKICEKEGMQTICGFKKISIVNADSSTLTSQQKAVKNFYLFLYRNFFVGFCYEMMSYIREFIKIHRLIRDVKPVILIIAGDNIGYNTDILVKICHKYGIPSAIIPLWMTNANEPAEAYYSNPAYDGNRFSNRFLGYLDPKWTYVHRKKRLIRWPAFKILAMKFFGLVPPLPWILNSSYADVILAAHQAMKTLMIREGIKSDQIRLTGSIVDDIMTENTKNLENRRDAFTRKLGLPKDKPILLCALPPPILYVFSRSQCDFKNYSDLVEFWIKSLLKAKNYTSIISLHPATQYDEIKYIEDWGVKISQEKIIDLIPLCDIFVASMSTTINFAVACGKPTINYDVYKFRDIYWKFQGVLDTEQKDEFLLLLKKLTGDKDFYSQVLAKQQSESDQCGMLDGKCSDRILACINDLANKNLANISNV